MRFALALSFIAAISSLSAQNTIAFQGFESGAPCPDWSYSGGVVNMETYNTGARSLRMGRLGESTTATFAPITVTGYLNVQLRLHHSVRGGSGPGMDSGEGASMQIRLDGGPWMTFGSVGGYGDLSWGWNSTGGTTSSPCGTTCPNPAVYNVPNGTNTVELRTYSNACPSGAIASYDRTDEGFFIDDVRLTTTSSVTPPGSGIVTWNGNYGTDWFDCRNWTPAVLPGPAWDVIIDQTAVNNCVVGYNTGTPSTAYCASLQLTSTSASRKLTIDNGRILNMVGAANVQRSGAGVDSVVLLVNNGTFQCGGLTVGGPGAVFRNNVATNTVLIKGDLLLSAQGKINITNGILGVEGNITNNATAALFIRSNSEVVLNGLGPQGIHANGFTDDYASLRVMKEVDDVTLFTPITLSGTLDLNNGRVFTDAVNIPTMKVSSAVINASDGSFVHGPMRKQGRTAFSFPVGKGAVLRPISIAGNTSGTGTFSLNIPTNEYTAEYFQASPRTTIGTALDASLDHISDCEYWTLDRTGTVTSSPFVLPTWATPTSCGVDLLSDLRVVRWNGSLWNDRGNGGTTGTTTSGSIATAAAQSAFGFWTLASMSTFNPLPIELLLFTAQARTDRVRLDWATLSEQDNDHFDVERSADGLVFSSISRVPGAGNSQMRTDYLDYDLAPLPGLSYYRLRQTDMNGTSTLSHVVPVHFEPSWVDDLTLTHTGAELLVHHSMNAGAYAIYDVAGRLCQEGSAPEVVFTAPLQALPRGIYVLRLSSGSTNHSKRFLH